MSLLIINELDSTAYYSVPAGTEQPRGLGDFQTFFDL